MPLSFINLPRLNETSQVSDLLARLGSGDTSNIFQFRSSGESLMSEHFRLLYLHLVIQTGE